MHTYDADDIFDISLKAELKKNPHLVGLNPKSFAELKLEEPGILFRGRLKGYFLCQKLCRIWVLQVMSESIARGEYFVKWVDLTDNSSHDGTLVFAHFFTMKYISLHEPGMSVLFDPQGALKTTSIHFKKLRDYIWTYRRQLARRTHDMLKQSYGTKKYAIPAWIKLKEWMLHTSTDGDLNLQSVLRFDKTSTDLHSVVAKCLWQLAQGANHPWGVGALQVYTSQNNCSGLDISICMTHKPPRGNTG